MMKFALTLALSCVCFAGYAQESSEEIVNETEVTASEETASSADDVVLEKDGDGGCGCGKGKGKGDGK